MSPPKKDQVKNENFKMVMLRMKMEDYKELKQFAEEDNRTISGLLHYVIKDFIRMQRIP